MPTDTLGDLVPAFARLETVSPGRAAVRISNMDVHWQRYGVTLWNSSGHWYASEPTLAESIHRAIDKAEADHFQGNEDPRIKKAGGRKRTTQPSE